MLNYRTIQHKPRVGVRHTSYNMCNQQMLALQLSLARKNQEHNQPSRHPMCLAFALLSDAQVCTAFQITRLLSGRLPYNIVYIKKCVLENCVPT